MVVFDADEVLTPHKDGRHFGAIVFDRQRMRDADPGVFSPAWWGERAKPITSGGRGSAWFIDAPFGRCVLRQYKRGGMMSWINHNHYVWRGADDTRSFAEFRLMRCLLGKGLPVPAPLAAFYIRSGLRYRAAILMQRLDAVLSLADLVQRAGSNAPWEKSGRLIARFHRHGLDHADLNAHNILYDNKEQGWIIDFDRSSLRIPATRWRERNLGRLLRSLLKTRGQRTVEEIKSDFSRLYQAYNDAWKRGC